MEDEKKVEQQYLLQLVKVTPVSSLELPKEGEQFIDLGGQKYRQEGLIIALNQSKLEALLALLENVENMAHNMAAFAAQQEDKID